MISKSLLALALAGPAFARTISSNVIADVFNLLGPAPDAHPVTFKVYLQEANMDGLTARMNTIATSGAKWLTEAELASYVTPTAATTSAVNKFLASANIPKSAISYNDYGDIATVSTTTSALKTLFPGTEFSLYSYLNNQIVRTTSLVIPDAVSPAISHIGSLAEFPVVKHFAPTARKPAAPIVKRADASKCTDTNVTPECLRTYYGDASYVVSNSSRTTYDITVMGYIGQYVSQKDLTQFLTTYAPAAAGYQIPISTVAGAVNEESDPGIEAMLDVETVVSHTWPLNSNFISYGTVDDPNDIFAETFDYLRSSSQRPGIVSISYGAAENGITASQGQAMCSSAQKLTALGTTIVISSGDSGVDGSGLTGANVCLGTALAPFLPTYPGGCPYVSSIGATMNFDPEIMVSDTLPEVDGFFSGAGRSNIFPIPSYQAADVKASDAQLNILQTPPGSYNTTGRSYPDYVACGQNYVVIVNGTSELVGGTSASAPTTASIFALLNNALEAKGKSTIGWSQPKFYPLISSGFNDITSGGSYGCALSSSLTPIGFPAHTGFDGASGLGSPIFSGLRAGLGA